MIEINLLSEESKVKTAKKALAFETKQILYLIPAAFGLLIILHIYLSVITVTKNFQLRSLENKWRSLEPQRKMVNEFRQDYELVSSDVNMLQQLTQQRINWSEKLNKLSLMLPSGVWFNELSLSLKDFILKGSAISLQKGELSLINNFLDNLKNDKDFFKDFNNMELTSIQRKAIAGYEVVDFILTGTLK